MGSVATVVGVHNALPYVKRTLDFLQRSEERETPLVIVDDCSEEETRDYLAGERDRAFTEPDRCLAFALLRNERQQLFTRTYNRGIRFAYHQWHPEFICCLNSDVDLKHYWLHWLRKAIGTDPRLGIVGYEDSPSQKKSLVSQVKMPEYITGHCMLLRVKMLEETGVLCESDIDGRQSPELAHLHGQAHLGSDRVLSWRANAAGWRTAYVNYAGLSHAAGQSWSHDLRWLQEFKLDMLWEANDSLTEEVVWIPT